MKLTDREVAIRIMVADEIEPGDTEIEALIEEFAKKFDQMSQEPHDGDCIHAMTQGPWTCPRCFAGNAIARVTAFRELFRIEAP